MISNNHEKIIIPNIDSAIPFIKKDNDDKKDKPKTKLEIDLFESLRREVTIQNERLIVKEGFRL